MEVNTAASVSAAVWESFFVKTVKHVNTKEDRYYYQSRNRCVASALCLLFLTWRRLSWNICSALEMKSLPSVGTCLYHSIFNLRSFIIPLVNASKPLSLFYSFRISILLRLDLPGQPSKFHCPLIMSSNFFFFFGGGYQEYYLQLLNISFWLCGVFAVVFLNVMELSNSDQCSYYLSLLHLMQAISSFMFWKYEAHIFQAFVPIIEVPILGRLFSCVFLW